MGKDIGRLYKNNRSKITTPIIKKPGLLSSNSHTLFASNSPQTSILSRLDNKHINTNHNKKKISNTDDTQSCVTPRKKVTVFRPLICLLI